MKTVSAADANRRFSGILRDVRAGETVLVTSRGEPVARIEPVRSDDAERAEREQAWQDLLEHLRTRPVMKLGKFNRDELYDD